VPSEIAQPRQVGIVAASAHRRWKAAAQSDPGLPRSFSYSHRQSVVGTWEFVRGPLWFPFFCIGSAEYPGYEFSGVASLDEASSDILEGWWSRKLSVYTVPTRHIPGRCGSDKSVIGRVTQIKLPGLGLWVGENIHAALSDIFGLLDSTMLNQWIHARRVLRRREQFVCGRLCQIGAGSDTETLFWQCTRSMCRKKPSSRVLGSVCVVSQRPCL